MLSQDSIQYLLTAGHCTRYSNFRDVTTRNGRYIGYTQWTGVLEEQGNLDAILVRIQAPDSAIGRMYYGPYSTSNSVSVTSAGPMDIGEVGCMSGATLGTVCGIKRSGAAVFESGLDARNTYAFSAYSTAGPTVAVVAGGDSGGPVFRVTASGTVHAYGIIRGGTSLAPCPSLNPDAAGADCYANVHVTPINRVLTALSNHGVSSVGMMFG